MNNRRRLIVALGAGAVAPAGLIRATRAFAQQFPWKPVRLVVPFPPGGLNDIVARMLAPTLGQALGQSVIVENRPGGSIVIGTEYVARAPADGHTMLIAGFSFMSNAALRHNLPYDSLKEFVGVARLVDDPYLISVNSSLQANSVRELVALARARPGEITFATNGIGTGQHLIGEKLKLVFKIDMTHVPYQGDSPATTAVIGGHANILMSTITSVLPHIASGKLRPIAVSSKSRIERLKDVPTLMESGVDFELTSNVGVVASAATPKETISRLGAEFVRAVQDPAMKDGFAKQGNTPAPLGPAEFDAVIRAEVEKIQTLVAQGNIKLDS